jgi:type II secretory pathway pseudopilin PulG
VILLLLAIALSAIPLLAAVQSWEQGSRRAKEAEFLFRGRAYERAIAAYHALPPHAYPDTFADLLEDRRGTRVLHHLRTVYADPLTGEPSFEPVRDSLGKIVGVRSTSEHQPLGMQGKYERYSDRIFGSAPAASAP